MDWKKIGRKLLFPPVAVLILLLPLGIGTMLYAMSVLGDSHPLTIGSYVVSFYTLTIWCVRVPRLLHFFRRVRSENRYVKRWTEDTRLRVNVTLTGSCLWNSAYALLQLGLGIYHGSFWFYSLAGYYLSLALMRLFLVRHSLRHRPGEKLRQELHRYRLCGWILLFMNLALSGMMLFMIRENRLVKHHEITTITMAAYTFTSLTMSIINVVRYRRYSSPVLSASKAISLASASVSMLTLEGTMLATFQSEGMTPEVQVLFLALTGAAVSLLIIAMAVYMIQTGNKKMKLLENTYGKQ